MERIIGNYLIQGDAHFPVDAETFEYIQSNTTLVQVLGNAFGDKVVLKGCEPANNGAHRSPGFVFLRTVDYPDGEVLYWTGGATTSGMHLKTEPVKVAEQGYEFDQAYTRRWLADGAGSENYRWTDFKDIRTLVALQDYCQELEERIERLEPEPVGLIQVCAGTIAKIPNNYVLCDGRSLKQSDYPTLYAALGTTYNRAPNAANSMWSDPGAGYFRVPDLRGRFLVGYYGSGDTDYNAQAKTGGLKTVRLTSSESGLPSHNHLFKWRSFSNDKNEGDTSRIVRGNTDARDGSKYTEYTGGLSASKAHENRPPYYTLAYIIKLK